MKIKIDKQKAYISYTEDTPDVEKLPGQCFVAKGCAYGELWVYSVEEWDRFCSWLDENADDVPGYKYRRHFMEKTKPVHIETCTRDDDLVSYILPIPVRLFDWLGGFEDDRCFSITYSDRKPDFWAAHWEIRNVKWDRNRSEHDFVLDSDDEFFIQVLLTDQTVVKKERNRLVLKDGTLIDYFPSENDSSFLLKIIYRNERPFKERLRIARRMKNREKYCQFL